MRSSECDVVSFYVVCCSVNVSVCFVCCVFVNCLVKQNLSSGKSLQLPLHLVGVFVFSVMWSELLMTSAINCPLWSSVYECQRVECVFTYPLRTGCGMFVMYCIQCCMSVSAVL